MRFTTSNRYTPKTLNRILKILRISAELTQDQISQKLNLSWQDIESGKTWKMSEVYSGKGGFKGVQNELAGKAFEKKAIKTPAHEKSNPHIHSQGSGSNGQTQIPSGGIDSGLIEGAASKKEVEYLIYLKNQQQSKSGGMQAKLGREMER